QKVVTYNIAPGYQHTFGPKTLLTINPFVREDRVNYYPSADIARDSPATLSQNRHLKNWGVRTDVSYVSGHNNLKIGMQLMQTRLKEDFNLGITDFTFNPVCLDAAGNALLLPAVKSPALCPSSSEANPNFNADLLPLDLRRG